MEDMEKSEPEKKQQKRKETEKTKIWKETEQTKENERKQKKTERKKQKKNRRKKNGKKTREISEATPFWSPLFAKSRFPFFDVLAVFLLLVLSFLRISGFVRAKDLALGGRPCCLQEQLGKEGQGSSWHFFDSFKFSRRENCQSVSKLVSTWHSAKQAGVDGFVRTRLWLICGSCMMHT